MLDNLTLDGARSVVDLPLPTNSFAGLLDSGEGLGTRLVTELPLDCDP